MEGFRVCVQVPLVCFFFLSLFFFFFRNLKRERNEKKSKAKQSVCFVLLCLCLCLCDRNGVVVLLMLNAKKYSIFNNELGLVFD